MFDSVKTTFRTKLDFNPCAGKKCGHGEICFRGGPRARCLCPPRCIGNRPVPRVCGTDGITYKNLCELLRTACIIGDTTLKMKHLHRCGSKPVVKPTTTTPPITQSPTEPPFKVSPTHEGYQELTEGERGNITCRIEGTVISYTWLLPNRGPLPLRIRPFGNILSFRNVLKGDGGVYTCEAVGGPDGNQVVRALVNVTIEVSPLPCRRHLPPLINRRYLQIFLKVPQSVLPIYTCQEQLFQQKLIFVMSLPQLEIVQD
ncbi:agrin-like [Pocillopora damicornis]|uniref:agrin-like n=1 Tax=Pocillopora damicornis TaxID=46731 RepID=UPI000F5524A3|nr:agrin-like [Pocillopora damicornis]